MNFFYLSQSILAALLTFALTSLGASLVFVIKNYNDNKMSFIFGFASGVMIAASFFSLLLPGIELAEKLSQNTFLPVSCGFLLGGAFILIIDLFLAKKVSENKRTSNILLMLAITLHNIPEGLAIGVAFGSVALGLDTTTLITAWILAIGIGLQNFPEGLAVSMPLKSDGMKNYKAFLYGVLSAVVEPFSAILGVVLVTSVRSILPVILGFAAGAMIYVVVEELIPSGKTNKDNKLTTLGVMLGFTVMMVLDIALG